MEGDPQRVLEGLLIAAYAVGANRAIIHINGAARLPLQRMVRALAKARAAGLIGDQILGSVFSCEVEIRRGACGFVRGQERTLLASIEGQRTSTGTKPSVSPGARLWGKPVVLSNIATLAAIPPVITAGSGERAIQDRAATRLFGVSGPVNRPGMVEVQRGTMLRALLFEMAAGLRDPCTLKGVRMVGQSEVVLGPESLDGSLESLDTLAAEARGVIAIPDGDSAEMSVIS
jgi:NADH:ubiquinone oxidoreductase subunit F (NADH-binding)